MLSRTYPNLHNIVRNKYATVATKFTRAAVNVSFRRSLIGNKLNEWHNLVASIAHINLLEGSSQFLWGLYSNVIFFGQAMYSFLVSNSSKVPQDIWRVRVPLKINVFLYFLERKVIILTKDNLDKRNWHGRKAFGFCSKSESIQHLFLLPLR